jgi:hypothetical protein
MNLGEMKKDKPANVEPNLNTGFQDFSAMQAGMSAPFNYAMFNQMFNMGNMPLMGNFPYSYMMGQQNLPPMKPSHNHGSKKTMNIPMASLDNYKDIKAVKEKFECLKDINDPSFKPEKTKDAEFFILRSSNDDDFHKVG